MALPKGNQGKEGLRTMKEKMNEILEAIAKLPCSGYGSYHFNEDLIHIIDKVMGYEEYKFSHGRFQSSQMAKVAEIIRRMEGHGIIKKSKSGSMFRVNWQGFQKFYRTLNAEEIAKSDLEAFNEI